MNNKQITSVRRTSGIWSALTSVGVCSLLHASAAYAVDFQVDNPDLKVRWDNTFKYTAAQRLKHPSAKLINSPPLSSNQDDGDRNFDKSWISNRLDIFSEFDLTYKDVGLRISGAGWYDQVYNQGTDGNSPITFNGNTTPYNQFSKNTRVVHGRNAELLDAFIFGKSEIAGLPMSFRAGQYSLLWGESLFFGNNGIAGTMAATDIVKLVSVPNSQFKEIVLPDKQLSAQLALNTDLSLGAYYKFSWRPNRFPTAGSFFGTTDVIAGGERFFRGAPNAVGITPYLQRTEDLAAQGAHQGGLQLKWHPGEADLGFYVTRFNDRNPVIYLYPGVNVQPAIAKVGEYKLTYNEHAMAYGLSASMAFGNVVINSEVSTRRRVGLLSDAPQIGLGVAADNSDNARFAKGNTAHANLSFLWSLSPNPISREGVLLGELAWNRRLSVTKNPSVLAALSERDAWGGRISYTPTYRQAWSGVDISVPTSVSFFPKGKSSAVPGFGVDHGGDMSVGVEATYLDNWRASISVTHFYGPENTFLTASPRGGATFSFAQAAKDRDFIALSIRRTF